MTRNTILIVEDDFLVALDVERQLTWAGYEVCGVAPSEAEALALAEKCRPDLAVVDISLDPGDGRNVARALSQKYGTAILFATGQWGRGASWTGRAGDFACAGLRLGIAASGAARSLDCPATNDHPEASRHSLGRFCNADDCSRVDV